MYNVYISYPHVGVQCDVNGIIDQHSLLAHILREPTLPQRYGITPREGDRTAGEHQCDEWEDYLDG